jgi:hypothetical protein
MAQRLLLCAEETGTFLEEIVEPMERNRETRPVHGNIGETKMNLAYEDRELPRRRDKTFAGFLPPEILELKRLVLFHEVLLEELRACRTETEKKVVLSLFLTAKVQMTRLAWSLGLKERRWESCSSP